MDKKKALKKLCIFIAMGLFLIGGIVYLFDPFYQYHRPVMGMEPAFFERETQVIGSVRNMEYDSVLLGSSEAENFDSTFLDAQFDCKTLKVIKGSGSVVDLLYYLNRAHEEKEIKQVFWCMDIFALLLDTKLSVYSEYSPKHLFTDTILDDFTYLFNKDVLFEKIPLLLAYSKTGTFTKGKAYSWGDEKTFSKETAMYAYQKPDEVKEAEELLPNIKLMEENIALIEEQIEAHKDVKYTVFFPPYSLMWWDAMYTAGGSEKFLVAIEKVLPMLLSHENVEVFFFATDRDITCNLDYYMDQIHYSPEISQMILNSLVSGDYKVTTDNVDEVIKNMRDTFSYMVEEAIYNYY